MNARQSILRVLIVLQNSSITISRYTLKRRLETWRAKETPKLSKSSKSSKSLTSKNEDNS